MIYVVLNYVHWHEVSCYFQKGVIFHVKRRQQWNQSNDDTSKVDAQAHIDGENVDDTPIQNLLNEPKYQSPSQLNA